MKNSITVFLALVVLITGCRKKDVLPAPETNGQNTPINPADTTNNPVDTNSNQNSFVYDVDANGIPKFVNTDYIVLDSVSQISKFRSGIGHDYSDDFETCRSMKHYYAVPEGTKINSPVKGKITFLLQEWAGYKIQIQSSSHPAFFFEIFHVNLSQSFSEEDSVSEGQLLGAHGYSGTMSDIAVFVKTPNDGPKANYQPPGMGIKYISYFEVMSDGLFQKYQLRGILNRDSCIITKAQRGSDPLDCNNWTEGNIANWVVLN